MNREEKVRLMVEAYTNASTFITKDVEEIMRYILRKIEDAETKAAK